MPAIRSALSRGPTASSTWRRPRLEAAAIVADGVDWLVVNETEAAAVLGRPVSGLRDAGQAATALGPRARATPWSPRGHTAPP